MGGDEVVVNKKGGEAVVVEVGSNKGHLSCQVAPGCKKRCASGGGQATGNRPGEGLQATSSLCVCHSFVRHLVLHYISHQASAKAIYPLGWSPLHLAAVGGQAEVRFLLLLPPTPATGGFPSARSKS